MKTSLVKRLAIASIVCIGIGCSSSSGSKEGPTDAGPSPITVQGTVIFAYGGDPAPGTRVRIGENATETDAHGAFTVTNVAPPYDVVLLEPAGEDPNYLRIVAYRGLTRPDPTLTLDTATAPRIDVTTRSATISGALLGGAGAPPPNGTWSNLSFVGPEARASEIGLNQQTGTFTMQLGWNDAPKATGTLYGLQFSVDMTANRVTAYPGYAERAIEVAPDQNLNADLAFQAPQIVTMRGAVNLPDGYYLAARRFEVVLGGRSLGPLQSDQADIVARQPSLDPTYTFLAPQAAGATVSLTVEAGLQVAVDMLGNNVSVTRRGLAIDDTQLIFDVPQAVEILEPQDQARDVSLPMELKWKASKGLKTIHVAPYGVPSGKVISFTLYTTGDSTTLPDPAMFGEALPPGSGFTWNVNEIVEIASVDAAAGGDVNKVADALTTVTQTGSGMRVFTTAQ